MMPQSADRDRILSTLERVRHELVGFSGTGRALAARPGAGRRRNLVPRGADAGCADLGQRFAVESRSIYDARLTDQEVEARRKARELPPQ